jgi:REP element-mobilizing transposase RayT
MPNHFHFLIHANEITAERIKRGMVITNPLSEGFRQMLSSYAKAINVQESRTGSCFQQNTKSKCLTLKHSEYSNLCFNYIHQNPMKAGLVEKMEDWQYSSFLEYLSISTENFCNQSLAIQLLDLNMDTFYTDSYQSIPDYKLKPIF